MRGAAVALLAVAGALAPCAARPSWDGSARPVAEGAEAVVASGGKARLRIEGISGIVEVSAGAPGEVRVRSAYGGRRARPLPVVVTEEGADLVIRPPAGGRSAPRRLEVLVPERLAVRVSAADARVLVRGISGEFRAEGRGLAVEAEELGGSLAVDLEKGSLAAGALGGGVQVTGADATVRVDGVAGDADVRLLGASHVTVSGVEGSLNVDVEEAVLTVRGVEGRADLRQRGGRASIEGLRRGGRLLLHGASVLLARSEGEIVLEGDGDLRVEDLDASLRVEMVGGSLAGSGLRAGASIRGSGPARVDLAGVSGAIVVEGPAVAASIREAFSTVEIRTTDADVDVEGVSAPVAIRSEGGDVAGRRLTGGVSVSAAGGSVALEGVIGPVQVEADGPSVRVAWVSNSAQADSRIRNAGGGVDVVFGLAGSCRVEAESSEGAVESDLRGVLVLEGGASAAGAVGEGGGPAVRVLARDDVRLYGGRPE